MNLETLIAAIGIAFVLEGLMPMLAPTKWRQVFSQMMELKDGQIRFIGLAAFVVGAILILL